VLHAHNDVKHVHKKIQVYVHNVKMVIILTMHSHVNRSVVMVEDLYYLVMMGIILMVMVVQLFVSYKRDFLVMVEIRIKLMFVPC